MKETEEWEEKEREIAFELENHNSILTECSNQLDSTLLNIDLKKILQYFDPEKDNMGLYLILFERQMKLLKVSGYVDHLLNWSSTKWNKKRA